MRVSRERHATRSLLKSLGFGALLLFGGAVSGRAQGIELIRIDQGIALLNGPSAAFGDLDDDGDLDILVSGQTAVEFPVSITRVYVGLGESERVPPGGGRPRWFREFEERGMGISAVWAGGVAWFDPNRDGRLEFVITGARNANPPYGPQAGVYRSNGSGFTQMSGQLVGLFGGSVDVGDYNNDGKEDLLMTGSDGQSYASLLYDGTGSGSFTPSSITLPAVGLGEGRFGDYDGDGDLDIVLVGDTESGLAAHLLRNDGGTFTEVQTGIEPVVFGSVDWGDYDCDGDLDLLVAGARLSPVLVEGRTHVYRNDGDGILTDVAAGIQGSYHGMARWGDMNNDGYLDVVQIGGSGLTELERVGQIYLNQQNGRFEFADNIIGLVVAAGDLGDYDGDGDLDIIELGQGAAALFRNEYYSSPSPMPVPAGRPEPPSDLQAVVGGTSVRLSWGPGSDDQTPASGLSYNIRVGTVVGSVDIVAPLAQPVNGKRKVSRLGNVQNNLAWTIHGLSPGTYYWSVQSLDATFSGSDFAADNTFVIE